MPFCQLSQSIYDNCLTSLALRIDLPLPSNKVHYRVSDPSDLDAGEEEMEETLAEGSKAPDFRLPSTTDGLLGPGSYAGQKRIVVAFYPRDNTSG